MATKYPNNIDDSTSLPKVFDLISPILADDHNRLRDAIIEMQKELGSNPSGTFSTVRDRLDNFLASSVTIIDTDGYFTATNVEDALRELFIFIDDLMAADIEILDSDGYYVSTNVEGALKEIGHYLFSGTGGSLGTIGDAEDGTYTDGLFEDFTPSTEIGVAVDRFNELFAALAPPAAPALADIGYLPSIGTSGKLSFGSSNTIFGFANVPAKDVNSTFNALAGDTNVEKGIYGTSLADKDGYLAESIPADTNVPTPSYPDNAFGDADVGLLQLWIDAGGVATKIHETDLAVFTSGNSLNANGSGFINMTPATSISFPLGSPLNLFKYRVGKWKVSTLDQQSGYNKVYVVHTSGSFTRTTNTFSWVNDTASNTTAFIGETLGSLSMSGSKYISGINYYTSGSASYGITVNNAYRNTYSSGNAVTYGSSTNITMSSDALPALPLSPGVEGTSPAFSKSPTISATRLINASITGRTTIARTRASLSGVTSSGASIASILMDNVSDNAANTDEQFNGEIFRVATNKALTDTSGYSNGGNDALWDQTISLVSGTAGYSDGLLVYNGILTYPINTSGVASGNFSAVTNGPANPNYSAASGTRYYWRYFYDSAARQNFSLNVTSSGTTFVTVGSGLTSTNVYLEVLAPNTTQNGLSVVEFKDARTAYTVDNAIGCLNGTFVATDWPITLGTKSTATSGNCIVIRITAGSAWTGSIDRIQLTWL